MSLNERDALLSRLLGLAWPHEPLLNAVNLAPDLDVLDVGAGEGRLLTFLTSRGHTGRLAGVDPQPGAAVQAGAAEHLLFPAHSFDVVFMVRMLTHCANPAQAISEARRVLRPDGQIIIAVHGKEHLQALMGGIPERGPEDEVEDLIQHMDFKRQDVKFHISLSLEAARMLLDSYGRSAELTEADFPLLETLHLTIFRHRVTR